MLRTAIAGALAGVMLTLGLAVGLPAGLPTASAGDADFGRLWRHDGVLRDGCHNYKYHYKVKPPKRDWALETFLVDPRKETIASGGFISDYDEKKGTGKFRFCRYNTEPGLFKIRGKLTWRNGYDQKVKWVKPGFFRLRRS
jgi:hypothetical protein